MIKLNYKTNNRGCSANAGSMLILHAASDKIITLNLSYLNMPFYKGLYKTAIKIVCSNNPALYAIYSKLREYDSKRYQTGIGNFNARLHEYMQSIGLKYYFSDGMVFTEIQL